MNNKPWLQNYPQGVSEHINPAVYTNLIELIEEAVNTYGEQIAFENMGAAMTFNQIDQLSDDFAAYLQQSLGLKKGDRIAIQMPNLLQYPIVMFGALKAGLIVVNTNPLYTTHEMAHQFKDSGAKAIVIVANFASNLEEILTDTDIKHVIVTKLGDLLGGLKGNIVNFVVKHIKKMVPPYQLDGHVSFKDALKEGSKLRLEKVELAPEDLAFLQYTGGTTGISKGAMLTHRNIIANMEQNGAWMMTGLVAGKEIVITALPLYHIFALTVNCWLFFKTGGKNILITNPRDLPAFIKELKKHPFSVFTGVNTLFNALLLQKDFLNIDFSNFKVAIGGGMAVQDHVAEKWKKVTGCPLAEGYGLTESSPVVACNPIDGSEKIGTIGMPLPSTDVRIVSDEGKDMDFGEHGEVWVRGPQVMRGYWNRTDETALVMEGDWLKTGDIGYMTVEGYIKLVDRKKEMINVSGFNVYPNEVEAAVTSHPKVAEAGVIGIPDEKSNETVKAFIIKNDPTLTKEEIFTYCKAHLTAYKRPKHIEFLEELPKSNVGKILRRKLKEYEERKSVSV
ncbi:AMP-binding protein [Persicobacter sp. CCB-QB2]|uniref:AMP-binding protein n=1 Tax=Persicobacter sp. CCB-QB2 TaxID=1561025 RepID=UPI0006A9C7F0|nr:AMP-binding protein [Persicobacter sp. CCB-QB2]